MTYKKRCFITASLLVATYPMGVAVHGFAALISLILLVTALMQEQRLSTYLSKLGPVLVPTILATLFIAWAMITTRLNSANPAASVSIYAFGHLTWIILPPLCFLCFPAFSPRQTKLLWKVIYGTAIFWGAIALSQALIGWRINGIIFESDLLRPRGFYSHPLTLAYAAIICFPLFLHRVRHKPKQPLAWSALVGISIIILFSSSRTIQAVAGILVAWTIITTFKGRLRYVMVSSMILGTLLIFSTDNQISSRFENTFTEKDQDRFSDYPDDRLAFWHAHWLMVKERPLQGHGITLDTKYRTPYYKKIGLLDFSKKYEAHNVYLQVLANTGLIGLVIFISWWGWFVLKTGKINDPFARTVSRQTLFAIMLSGITQNSFQDSEVRMGITLTACVILVLLKHENDCAENSKKLS